MNGVPKFVDHLGIAGKLTEHTRPSEGLKSVYADMNANEPSKDDQPSFRKRCDTHCSKD
jgi:hypothetical protein